ncbi:MAG: hypothetical protein GY744_16755 [Gammaproteobacteria bacterium]|nr:hypothetical protein [Gammaproteobacteria bacterium]
MTTFSSTTRYLHGQTPAHLLRPKVRLQPIQSGEGTPSVDLADLTEIVDDVAIVLPAIRIKSPEHWQQVVSQLDDDIDAIIPVSIPSYPTEIWNSHPQPLAERGLPFIFWPLIKFDEPDFWRWSARDMLQAIGVDVQLVKNNKEGLTLLRALAMKRFLTNSKLVVFGTQNFPWNAHAAGHLITESLGTEIIVKPLSAYRDKYHHFNDELVQKIWSERGARYDNKSCNDKELQTAIRSYLSIKSILEQEQALGFGVNCFGDLIPAGSRDVPCLAQLLLREDGYIAACDGDYLAMMSMVLTSYFLDKPCMMSNMYPVQYIGALSDHFGDPLSPEESRFPRQQWTNIARLAHCGFVGIVSPEMTPDNKNCLKDWGGTFEIPRDGRGCGCDGDLAAGEKITVIELKFDGETLLIADAETIETTRHNDMPHNESTGLLKFRNLPDFIDNISREHTVIVYGNHVRDYEILASVLNLQAKVF